MSTREFTMAWAGLSPIQKEATEWDEGPMLVLAGPGTGKTRVLTCHLAKILESSRDENFRILALTFTNKAAGEMRDRVTDLVPGSEERLFIGTFHSFCADVLRQHGVHLDINPNFQIYSQDADLQAVLNDAVEEAKKTHEIISDLDKKTLPIIKSLKARLILPDACRKVFQDAILGERMAVIYPAYEAELAKQNSLDFNSLILKAYQLLTEFPAFAKRYRAVYPHFCIDEFQDTNSAQYGFIRAFTGDNYRNLFVVADDDQIIYQWNGASHKRIVEFRNDYSPEVTQLPVNYRCPPEIVALANNLIRHNFLRVSEKKPLEPARPSLALGSDTIRLLPVFPDFESEALGIARDIKELHSVNLDTTVVLGRSRKLLDGMKHALRMENVPAEISQRKDEFESTPFVWLHSLLRLANNRSSSSYLEIVCGTFAQLTGVEIDPEDVIIQAQSSNRDYLQHWIKFVLECKKGLNTEAEGIINQASSLLGEGRYFRKFSKLSLDWFSKLTQKQQEADSDPTIEVFARYAEERIVWEELMREITESLGAEMTLETLLQELQMRSKESLPKPGVLVLMTIHGAKGKEFDHVYLVGLVDDELPSFQSKRKGENSPEMEEERRNCFVAITRTIETLTLSYAEKYRGWSKSPSRFLFEMGLLND